MMFKSSAVNALKAFVPTAIWLASAPVSAQEARGSVPYFIMHPADLAQQTRACALTGSGGHICHNALKANYYNNLALSRQRSGVGRNNIGSIDSPLYYDANPGAREMVLRQCNNPIGGIFQPDKVQCQAARLSAGKGS